MRATANAFQVYHITGDPAKLGLTFLFQALPSLGMGLFGGTLADVVDRRLLLRVAIGMQVLLALFLGALTATGNIQVWHIYAVTFVASAMQSVTGPAQQALMPKLVPKEILLNAVALQSTSGQVAMLIGPLLGGLVVDTMGASFAYFFDAALIFPAIIALALLRIPSEGERRKIKLNVGAIFEGLTFTIKSRILLAFILLDVITMVLGYYPAMMPVMAEVLKVRAFGLGVLLAAPAAGAMLGFLGVLLIGNVRKKGLVIILVTIGHAVALIGFALSPWFWMSVVLVAGLGFMDSLSVTVRITSFQLLPPDELRGRVMSVLFVSAVSSNALGGAYLGWLTAHIGARHSLGLGGLIAGLFAIGVLLLWKRVREYEA